jgi:hypothetical protein
MSKHDVTIYQQFRGKFVKVGEPRNLHRDNFLIVWQGMDWSGFRMLADCETQFPSLEARTDASKDNFCVVER